MTMPTPPEQITLRWHEDDDGSFWGEVVELPGCFVSGADFRELEEALAEAVRLYLTSADNPVSSVTLKRREDEYREDHFQLVAG